MMSGPNVPTVKEQRGSVVKSKLSSDTGMAVPCRNRSVELAGREKDEKRLADILNARGTVNLIAVHGMTARAMMIESAIGAYCPLSFGITLYADMGCFFLYLRGEQSVLSSQ